MKRLLYGVILATVLLIPNQGTDVGKLIPVEVIAVSESENGVTVRTDTEDTGAGATLAEAFRDLEDTAPGMIYLDTAEYLIIETGSEELLGELNGYLKKSIRVCKGAEELPLTGVADYLSAHQPDRKLGKIEEYSQIPELREENGRYLLLEK